MSNPEPQTHLLASEVESPFLNLFLFFFRYHLLIIICQPPPPFFNKIKQFKYSVSFNSQIMGSGMVNFMCQLDWVIGAQIMVKHYSGCVCESVLE